MFEPGESMLQADRDAEASLEAAGAAVAAAAPGHRASLWRNAEYLQLWTAAALRQMGSQVSLIAIPFIAAVVLHAAAFQVALLGAFEMLPFILFTLPAGAWLDRVRRRPVLIAGDFRRAAALISIPIAYALGVLTIWQLYAVGLTTGFLTVLFDVADQSYLPVLLDPEDLVEGNAKLQIPASAAQIVGPGFSGGLIGIIAAPFAIVIDAASFVVSGSLISLVRKHEPKPERKLRSDGSRTSLRQEIAEGLRYVLGNRYLRMIAGATGTFNLGSSMAFAVFPVFVYRELALSPALVGTAISLGSLGVLLGAFLAAPVARRLGVGPTIILSSMINGPGMIILAFLPSTPIVAGAILVAAMGLGGICGVIYNVNQVSFRQAITPLGI